MDRVPQDASGGAVIRYCPDNTGRFAQRPYYEESELDRLCEQAIKEFMEERCGGLMLPIPTDALTKLIERDAEDLDLYADLSWAGPGTDGFTRFFHGRKPDVKIARELYSSDRRKHRLRTTLSHEYAHVMLHDRLWEARVSSPEMLEELARKASPVCKRDKMIEAPSKDWMEWQAGHCCGALLMPITSLNKVVSEYFERHNVYGGSVRKDSSSAGELIYIASKTFFVSWDAARVRLSKLGYLSDYEAAPSLFDA